MDRSAVRRACSRPLNNPASTPAACANGRRFRAELAPCSARTVGPTQRRAIKTPRASGTRLRVRAVLLATCKLPEPRAILSVCVPGTLRPLHVMQDAVRDPPLHHVQHGPLAPTVTRVVSAAPRRAEHSTQASRPAMAIRGACGILSPWCASRTATP